MQFDQFNDREFIAVAARMLADFAAMQVSIPRQSRGL
jgi:hypothetical protein